MSATIVDSAPPLSEDDITHAEERIGRLIPAAYRAFLHDYNGGRPTFDVFSIRSEYGRLDRSRVNRFFGINTGKDFDDLELVLEDYRDRIPFDFFPVADDPFGNLICLSTGGEQPGAIYFWDHEREIEQREKAIDSDMLFVANTFVEFLDSLCLNGSK